jgi:mRNA interferase YafQ
MLAPAYTKRFAKDLKKMMKLRKIPKKIKRIIKTLVNEKYPDAKHENYKLIGSYKGRRECHFKPGWLLIYKIIGSEIIFERTGKYSDIYEKNGVDRSA